MIDVDIRRYGSDKDYQDAVNKYLKGTSSPIYKTGLTLEDARYCLSEKSNGCAGCKYEKQGEIDCRGEALKMGAECIDIFIKKNEEAKILASHQKYGR